MAMPWGSVEKRVVRVVLDLMLTLGSTRVFFQVGKHLGIGEIAWWKEEEGFRGIPRRRTINPTCHHTPSPRGAELQALWWAEDKLPAKIQPGRAEGSPALCQEAQTQGAITRRHTDQDRVKRENPGMSAFL